jgi:hypothetical protein
VVRTQQSTPRGLYVANLEQVYLFGSFFIICVRIWLLDAQPSPIAAHLATWVAATVLEIVLIAPFFVIHTHTHTRGRLPAS